MQKFNQKKRRHNAAFPKLLVGSAACARRREGKGRELDLFSSSLFHTPGIRKGCGGYLNASRMPPPLFLLEDIYEIGRDFRYIGVGEIGI